jgi:hypothetical protein
VAFSVEPSSTASGVLGPVDADTQRDHGDAGVVERLPGCVVAEHDPGRVTVGETHPLHRAPGPSFGEVTERVIADH